MTLIRRSSRALLDLATRILPATRRDWARDMRAELDYVESDAAALSWAFGCVLASVNQRVIAMLQLNGQVSRPVLVLEWLACFAPLTLLWCVAVNYIVRSQHVPLDTIVATAAGTLGPIALVASLFVTLSGSNLRFGRIAQVLAGAFAVMTVLQLASAGAKGRLNLAWFQFDASVLVLFSLLPLIGCLHLAYLSRAENVTAGAST